MTLPCDDLKLHLRLTYIHNWYLQRHFRSKINTCNKTCSFQTPSILYQRKYDDFHLLTENYTLGGYVCKTGISRSRLGQLKITPLTAAILKLKYQSQQLFYGNYIIYSMKNYTLG